MGKTSLETQVVLDETIRTLSGVLGHRERGATARFYRKNSARLLDELFFTLIAELSITNLLECGAHEGTASKTFLSNGGERAITIEANPDVFERKTRKIESLGAEVINIGLADTPGHLNFHIPEGNLGAASFRQKRAGEAYVEVPTTTIDTLHRDKKIKGPVALWVDVEGFAFEVLSGAEKTLADPQTLLLKVEMEDNARWIDQKTFLETAPLLENAGFAPIFSDMEYVYQFNVIYVRSEAVDACRDQIERAKNQLRELAAMTPA